MKLKGSFNAKGGKRKGSMKEVVTLEKFNELLLKSGFEETCKAYKAEDAAWSDYHLTTDTLDEFCKLVTRVYKTGDGLYVFCGHLADNVNIYKHFPYLCYRLKLYYSVIDGLNAYASSDEQLLLVTYCESDVSFIPYTDEEKYLSDKQKLIEKMNHLIYGGNK